MSDQLRLVFSAAEGVGAALRHEADALADNLARLRGAVAALQAGGLRGAFLDELDAHCDRLYAALQFATDETAEAGADLLAVVERARALDAECAALFWRSATWPDLPASGGSAPAARLGHVTQSIGALTTIRAAMQAQVEACDAQINSPFQGSVNFVLGRRDDYERIRAGLQTSIASTDARLAALADEQAALERLLAEPPPMPPEPEPAPVAPVPAPPIEAPPPPAGPTTIGNPNGRKAFVHNQNAAGHTYDCALYAQASVMEALGMNFQTELAEARQLGLDQGWYTPNRGSSGLGEPFRANGIPYEIYGWSDTTITRDSTLDKLEAELTAGHYPIVNLDATRLSAYHGTGVLGHSVWITGVELDAQGYTTAIIANDTFWGEARSYPVGEFLDAWSSAFNYYAVFARPPE